MGVTKSHDRLDRLKKAYGRRLRAARTTAGYEHAEDFAEDLNIESPRYRRYERGETLPPLDVLADIVKKTACDLRWLLLGHTERKKNPRPPDSEGVEPHSGRPISH